jgi:hypothetical protein
VFTTVSVQAVVRVVRCRVKVVVMVVVAAA